MAKPEQQGPAESILTIAKRIFSLLVSSCETRLQLLVVELEEEKANVVSLLLLVGTSLLLLSFALLTVLFIICFAIDPAYRFNILLITAITLFILAAAMIMLTLRRARRSTFLRATLQQLECDKSALKKE